MLSAGRVRARPLGSWACCLHARTRVVTHRVSSESWSSLLTRMTSTLEPPDRLRLQARVDRAFWIVPKADPVARCVRPAARVPVPKHRWSRWRIVGYRLRAERHHGQRPAGSSGRRCLPAVARTGDRHRSGRRGASGLRGPLPAADGRPSRCVAADHRRLRRDHQCEDVAARRVRLGAVARQR